MTRLILVGGYPHKAPDGGKAFCEEVVKGVEGPIRLLDCLFARPKDNWEKAYAQDKEFFTTHLPGRQLVIELAQIETFAEQVREADAVYIRGGTTRTLIEILNSIPNWKDGLEGKTLAGSSAGADAIAKYYYNLDTLELETGLGFIEAKMIPHWNSDYNAPNINWEQAKQALENFHEPLPVYTLAEGEFVVLHT